MAAEIGRIAAEIMASPGGSEARQGKFARLYPAFSERYPKLFDMCCGAQASGEVPTILKSMLDRLVQIEEGNSATDAATKEVHRALETRYVDPLVAAADAAKQATS
jgi:hypothetical protein